MNAAERKLRALERKMDALPQLESAHDRAVRRRENGTLTDADLDLIFTEEELEIYTWELVEAALPYRRVRAAGHEPFVSEYFALPLGGMILSFLPHESPPRRLVDRVREVQAGFETDNEEWASKHVAWVLLHRLLGAPDGLPLRRRMAAGEFGPEAASPNPPAGFGREECPLACGARIDYRRCVCTGTAPDLCWRMALLDPPHPALVAAEEKRLAWVAAREAADAARTGQPRPDDDPPASRLGERPPDPRRPLGPTTDSAPVPYSEPAGNEPPPRRTNLNRVQTIGSAIRPGRSRR